jgi:hypothetical protein
VIKTFCGNERFNYWDGVKLVDIVDADELIEEYTNQDGEHHYFDHDTMEFFGTESFQMVAPGISIEYQANAPDSLDKWSVHAWVTDDDMDTFTSYGICRHADAASAAICGHITYQEMTPGWNGMEYEGFCSDHGESLQEGCTRCAEEEN